MVLRRCGLAIPAKSLWIGKKNMNSPRFDIILDDPKPADGEILLDLLDEDSKKKTTYVERGDFAVLLRDPDTGKVIGGVWGEDDYGWAFICYLVVPKALQGQGLGTRLMDMAEKIARDRGAVGMWLYTYEFQAKNFYQKIGFELFGSLDAGTRAVGQHFLRKSF